ncbi:mortality factor 4-like protein 1 [Fusarium flagelliforme]|uniref:Chromatin modification-related protein EAF3 n=1 Tax=Fusarium flagelliforme TaxID=2675880 RepID=A0A395MXX7_9HYPO|nr:mortality factor 4-like protein 1 [Fusarium flagelliforme]
MAPARQQPAPPPFSKDEKVLCFHMDMLYEAKIMDVQQGEKPSDGYKYKVHYKGWKNTWDDWVLVDRIRPFDDEHKELAAQLHAQVKHNIQRSTKQPKKGLRSGAESARVSEERSGSATVQGGRGGRRGKDWELEQSSYSSTGTLIPHIPLLPVTVVPFFKHQKLPLYQAYF